MSDSNQFDQRLCIVVTGGSIDREQLKKHLLIHRDKSTKNNPPYIIGVDNGCQILIDLQIPFDLAVGDFDTLHESSLLGMETGGQGIIKLNPMKDLTDSHYAMEKAVDMGFKKIIIYGGTGTRLDHSLANLMTAFSYPQVKICFVNRTNLVEVCHGNKKYSKNDDITVDDYKYISLIPVEPVIVSETFGLKYNICNQLLKVYDSLGVSNEIIDESFWISLEKGKLFVIYSRD